MRKECTYEIYYFDLIFFSPDRSPIVYRIIRGVHGHYRIILENYEGDK